MRKMLFLDISLKLKQKYNKFKLTQIPKPSETKIKTKLPLRNVKPHFHPGEILDNIFSRRRGEGVKCQKSAPISLTVMRTSVFQWRQEQHEGGSKLQTL